MEQKNSEHPFQFVIGDPMMPHPFRIEKIRNETYDTFTIELSPQETEKHFNFSPGQFNMLYAFGVGEVPISISGSPKKTKNLTHTIRAVGTVTKAIRKLKKGAMLGIRGPYGNCWPVEKAKGKDVVIIAGGIGLAPLRPSMYHILAHREQYNKVILLYGTRTPEDILFLKELEQWRSRLDFDVFVTVDRGDKLWKGNVGVVTTLISKAHFDAKNTVAMICGPEIMMRFTVMELQKSGMNLENIYVSMERNMKCAIGICGHCQYGSKFICKDGSVFPYSDIKELFTRREL
ncbi:MAG: FAD/NAD(P)-binding protein [Bacteroidota bacterium]